MAERPRSSAVALGLARIVAGLLFVEHGIQKLFGAMGGFGAPGRTAALMSRFGVAGVLEFVGGLLIVAGAWTRPVAALLAVEMIVAFSTAHLPRGGWPIENEGELALLYAAMFLVLVAFGDGAFSIDGLVRRRD